MGTEDVPYGGKKAKITLVARPHEILELPLYGGKALAVRDGLVVFHGQHKVRACGRVHVLCSVAGQKRRLVVTRAGATWGGLGCCVLVG